MSDPQPTRAGMWSRALELADQTPTHRNRYADLLRAVAITCVVLGHWTMAAPVFDAATGKTTIEHLLAIQPWTRGLTWLFQVMPLFFFVGGFSNGTSWASTQRKGGTYQAWFASRLQRLLRPTMVLLAFWVVATAAGAALGVPGGMITSASQIAMIPTWFLAVYILVCMVVPLTWRAWERWGLASAAAPMALAAVMDLIFFTTPGLRWMTWSNFLFIWLAIHQLGYVWIEGLRDRRKNLALGVFGLLALGALMGLGPYPTSLVGVPGETLADGVTVLSNTRPPKLPLLALGMAQIGLLLAIKPTVDRWLARRKVWAATVLANGMIMTVFLWHSTAMMLLFGVGVLFDGQGLTFTPGSAEWWITRGEWIGVFVIGTIPFVGAFRRFERASAGPPLPTAALLIGCLITCLGLALMAISGTYSADGPLGLSIRPIIFAALGAALCLGSMPRHARDEAAAT